MEKFPKEWGNFFKNKGTKRGGEIIKRKKKGDSKNNGEFFRKNKGKKKEGKSGKTKGNSINNGETVKFKENF